MAQLSTVLPNNNWPKEDVMSRPVENSPKTNKKDEKQPSQFEKLLNQKPQEKKELAEKPLMKPVGKEVSKNVGEDFDEINLSEPKKEIEESTKNINLLLTAVQPVMQSNVEEKLETLQGAKTTLPIPTKPIEVMSNPIAQATEQLKELNAILSNEPNATALKILPSQSKVPALAPLNDMNAELGLQQQVETKTAPVAQDKFTLKDLDLHMAQFKGAKLTDLSALSMPAMKVDSNTVMPTMAPAFFALNEPGLNFKEPDMMPLLVEEKHTVSLVENGEVIPFAESLDATIVSVNLNDESLSPEAKIAFAELDERSTEGGDSQSEGNENPQGRSRNQELQTAQTGLPKRVVSAKNTKSENNEELNKNFDVEDSAAITSKGAVSGLTQEGEKQQKTLLKNDETAGVHTPSDRAPRELSMKDVPEEQVTQNTKAVATAAMERAKDISAQLQARGGGVAKVEINNSEMGNVKLELKMSGNNELVIHVRASDSSMKAELEKKLDSLKESLGKLDVKLADFNVVHDASSSSSTQNQSQKQFSDDNTSQKHFAGNNNQSGSDSSSQSGEQSSFSRDLGEIGMLPREKSAVGNKGILGQKNVTRSANGSLKVSA